MTRLARRPPRLLTAALAAADRGWPVFPVHPSSKRPAVNRWQTVATCDPDTIAVWWATAPYNVGIACGPAGLLVVDLDINGSILTGADGVDMFAALAAEAGTGLASTYTVATPSGGLHRYYTVCAGQPAQTTTGLLAPQVDTRGIGGCVLAAGSVLRRPGGNPGFYQAICTGPAAPLPAWLASRLKTPARLPSRRPQSTVRRPDAYAATAVAGEADRVRTAPVGTRNATLFGAAVRLGRLTADGMLAAGDAYGVLLTAASVHIAVEGFTAAEADRAIRNGLGYEQRRAAQKPESASPHDFAP